MEELEKPRPMPNNPPKFDERALTPRQRRAWLIAQEQGVAPISRIDELLVMDVSPTEAAEFDELLFETRRESRATTAKRSLD